MVWGKENVVTEERTRGILADGIDNMDGKVWRRLERTDMQKLVHVHERLRRLCAGAQEKMCPRNDMERCWGNMLRSEVGMLKFLLIYFNGAIAKFL